MKKTPNSEWKDRAKKLAPKGSKASSTKVKSELAKLKEASKKATKVASAKTKASSTKVKRELAKLMTKKPAKGFSNAAKKSGPLVTKSRGVKAKPSSSPKGKSSGSPKGSGSLKGSGSPKRSGSSKSDPRFKGGPLRSAGTFGDNSEVFGKPRRKRVGATTRSSLKRKSSLKLVDLNPIRDKYILTPARQRALKKATDASARRRKGMKKT